MKNQLLIALGVVVVFFALIFGSWAWKYYTAPIQGKVDAEVQIESAQSRIQWYNHFHDLCSVVESNKESLRVQQMLLESSESNDERIRIRANIGGIKAQIARNVNRYNADAAKDYTAARFKDGDLPYQLSVDGETYCN
jgi:hypothetical protein